MVWSYLVGRAQWGWKGHNTFYSRNKTCYEPLFLTPCFVMVEPIFLDLSSHKHAAGNSPNFLILLPESTCRLLCSHLFSTPVVRIPLSCCCVCDNACESKIVPRFIYLQFTLQRRLFLKDGRASWQMSQRYSTFIRRDTTHCAYRVLLQLLILPLHIATNKQILDMVGSSLKHVASVYGKMGEQKR